MRRVVLIVPVAALAATLAGCGNSASKTASLPAPTSSSVSAPATVTDTVVPPATTATVPAATSRAATTGPTACTTADLTVTIGAGDGTAGSVYYPLHFLDKASTACTITAFAGVSFGAPGNGAQVGAAATRSTAATPTVTLSPGSEATAMLQVADYLNYTPSQCNATAVSGFRVYPPNNTASAYVVLPGATKACATGPSQLSIQPVVAGSGV
jgi:hypothetical protein